MFDHGLAMWEWLECNLCASLRMFRRLEPHFDIFLTNLVVFFGACLSDMSATVWFGCVLMRAYACLSFYALLGSKGEKTVSWSLWPMQRFWIQFPRLLVLTKYTMLHVPRPWSRIWESSAREARTKILVYIYIYIYVYREREIERERQSARTHQHIPIHKCICI